jgi:hypothetical protein
MPEHDQKPNRIDLLSLLNAEAQALKNGNRALGGKIADTIVEKFSDRKLEEQKDIPQSTSKR